MSGCGRLEYDVPAGPESRPFIAAAPFYERFLPPGRHAGRTTHYRHIRWARKRLGTSVLSPKSRSRSL